MEVIAPPTTKLALLRDWLCRFNIIVFFISLTILIVVLGASRLRSRRSLWFEYIFIFSVIAVFIFSFYLSYQQYQIWSKNDISKHLLPPYTSINYFVFYAFTRFFLPYLVSLAAAVLFLFSAKILNKKYKERFFYPEEYYFGALGIFLTGHPGWLFYLALLIILYLFIHLFNRDRLSTYWLWIPVAIFVIIMIKIFLLSLSYWQGLVI